MTSRTRPNRRGAAVAAPDLPTRIACAGCGWRAPAGEPVPLACPAATPRDDVDHVLGRRLDPARLHFPGAPAGEEPNPFVRYRELFHAYHVARAAGWTDADYVGLVNRLDDAIAALDGHGFRATPFAPEAALAAAIGLGERGTVLVKDETGNVSGSHKARHLMGTLLELTVAEGLEPGLAGRRLAIASCGNAALAAAVVARAAGRPLDVFIPPDADPAVVARLRELGARLEVCERPAGVRGDPTYHRLLAALAGGALAFTCQGNLNGLAIEGGETLGWELVSELRAAGRTLDRLFVQVGGGALASACVQAFDDARSLGEPVALPRLHAVQARGVFPLARAYDRLAARLLGEDPAAPPADQEARAERLRVAAASAAGRRVLAGAARHRSAFMWPWEEEPRSVAGGILDDETYDWLAVVRGMLESGGYPIVVDEPTLVEANETGRATTGIDVDPTGSAGLAGLIELTRRGVLRPDETVAVLFTGVRRRPPPNRSSPARPSIAIPSARGERS